MSIKKLIAPVLTLLLINSCAMHSKNEKLIIGKWRGVEWLTEGNASGHDAQKASFNFEKNGNYSFDYDGSKETGTFIVENDNLFTKPLHQLEIMVEIKKLTKDSLVFDMNSGGQEEQLTLLRN